MSDDIPESDRLYDFPHPREQSQLLGHARAQHSLLEAYRSGRMPHAWLITGHSGIGKATLAYRLARFIFKYPDPASVPVSAKDLYLPEDDPVFQRLAHQAQGDLQVLRRNFDTAKGRLQTRISVDQVRRVNRFFSKTAGQGGWRICIIDCVDDMNINAANALLKTLEEPPARALLLLVCHAPGRLLDTVRSRCRKLPLSPLAPETIEHLLDELAGLDPAATQTSTAAIARMARGSCGRALMLAHGDGLELYRSLISLIGKIPDIPFAEQKAFAEKLVRRNNEENYQLFMDLLVSWIAELPRRLTGATHPPEIIAGEQALAERLGQAASLARWGDVWENITGLMASADALNLDKKQVIYTSFNKISALAAHH